MIKIELDKLLSAKLGKALEEIDSTTRALAESAVSDVARATFAKAKEMAFNKLNTTAQEYSEALSLNEIGDGIYSLVLRGDKAFLETGYGKFDMKPGLLRNAKKESKEGYKYRAIPMQQGGAGTGRIKSGTTRGDMLQDLKSLKKVFGDKGITLGADGKPVKGKVFSITQDKVGRWNQQFTPGSGLENQSRGQMPLHKNLSGVTKYQYEQKMKNGGTRTKSAYIVYRTVSENPKYADKWVHKGFAGAKIFPDLEHWATEQIRRRLDEVLK